MKIVCAHDVFKPIHSGYRGNTMLGNPGFEFVDSARDAQYIFYCAWGDSADIYRDMESCTSFGLPCIFHLTGDLCYVKDDEHLYFTTHLLKDAACRQFQVPYHYESKKTPGYRPRGYFASFQGSDRTNPDRKQLIDQQWRHKVIIRWTYCWETPEQDREPMHASYKRLLMGSKYTLCPRGQGPSSIRVVEAMLHGSVPILIDDDCRLFEDEMSFAPRCSYRQLDDVLENLKALEGYWEFYAHQMNRFVNEKLLIDKSNGHPTEMGHSDYVLSKLNG